MKSLLLTLCIGAAAVSAHAQAVLNVTTVVVPSGQTNTVAIPAGEAARVVMIRSLETLSLEKAGYKFTVILGDVVQGPASFEVPNPNCCTASLLSLERWKVKK